MNTIMNDNDIKTLPQVRAFLDGTRAVEFSMHTKSERYDFVRRTLIRLAYHTLSKPDKGAVLSFLVHVSGYSRIQVKRLVKTWLKHGQLRPNASAGNGFTRKYTDADRRLLAELDELHETLSGQATKKLCERAWQLFDLPAYQCLAGISVSHLYNLRHSSTYQRARRKFEKTRSKKSPIGERRKPQPDGQPGYIRVDTVHQGDQDGVKGLYHINAVDEVTQFDIVCAVEKISERYLIPVLEQLLDQFPFIIVSFHADNGSEYINQHVVKLLKKLLIELTKSRARHSNDNALVESKNGSIVRKHLGYSHIQQHWAPLVDQFHQHYLNPYINYHRPCFFPVIKTNAKGKQVKTYPYEAMMTPFEKFKSLDDAHQYLKPGITMEELDAIAMSINDNEAAQQLKDAKQQLFKTIAEQSNQAA
ncbi:MAG: integrase [Gammaproteobacteria bacterium]|nr:MAG: integrase [Gammaproteobacteria bacterium]